MYNFKANQLEVLCKECMSSFKLITPPYWTSECYGFGRYIREYGYFPKWLPLCIYTDHAPGGGDNAPARHELESSSPVQLMHDPGRIKHWKAVSGKICYSFYSPFVFYRKENGIERKTDAVGTLAFPAHSTELIDDISNMQPYIDQLKKLPSEYQPVSICLHMHDINKGLHEKFMVNGFDVYTAGHVFDDNFIERFYSIIKNFKYATSNLGGSYLYYCVEMGLPFFLYGDMPSYINKGDPNIESGEYTSYKKGETYQKVVSLFSDITTIITEEQKKFVNTGLGIYDGISRVKMVMVLYYALIRWCFRWSSLVYIFTDIRTRSKGRLLAIKRRLFSF